MRSQFVFPCGTSNSAIDAKAAGHHQPGQHPSHTEQAYHVPLRWLNYFLSLLRHISTAWVPECLRKIFSEINKH